MTKILIFLVFFVTLSVAEASKGRGRIFNGFSTLAELSLEQGLLFVPDVETEMLAIPAFLLSGNDHPRIPSQQRRK